MAKSILASFKSVAEKQEKNENDIQYIFYKDIRPTQKNRKIQNIEELAKDIEEDGLDHNLVVRAIQDSVHKYEIVSGHRRFAAICLNIQNQKTAYEYIPCKVHQYDDMEHRRRLHLNNINTQGYSVADMIDAIEELQNYYTEKKQSEGLIGRVQTLISNDISLHKSQVGNYQKIIKNASEATRQLIRDEIINLATALELCNLSMEQQDAFIEENNISVDEIREYANALNGVQSNIYEFIDGEDVPVTGTHDEDYEPRYEDNPTVDIEDDIEEYYKEDVPVTGTQLSIKQAYTSSVSALEALMNCIKSNTMFKEENELLVEIMKNLEMFEFLVLNDNQ